MVNNFTILTIMVIWYIVHITKIRSYEHNTKTITIRHSWYYDITYLI